VTYAFGRLVVDAGARTLSSASGPVHLTRKAFDLLLLLLERRPRAVSKQEIHDRIWPDAFVTESSIQSLIHEIRQAIDEPGAHQSWLRTVHGVGYGFCGEVVASDAASSATRRQRPAAWLVGESAPVALYEGENVVGRGADDDVIEIDAPTVSRRHARIVIAGEAVTLEDLGSKNGTWLDGQRLAVPRALDDEAVLKLGSATFTFRLARHPKPTESAG
jgi:DNA-binding winged helix-turn-helix (wHTH) protein